MPIRFLQNPKQRCTCLGANVGGTTGEIKSAAEKKAWGEASSFVKGIDDDVQGLLNECEVDVRPQYQELSKAVTMRKELNVIETASALKLGACGISAPFQFPAQSLDRALGKTRRLTSMDIYRRRRKK